MRNGTVESIEDLHNELLKVDEIKSVVSINNGILKIVFHGNFTIEVCFHKGFFNTYINSIFYYDIDYQDILDSLIETAKDTIIIQRKRISVFKSTFTLIPRKAFRKEQWEKIGNVKVFTATETIFDNF
jgi:hypothetical protein